MDISTNFLVRICYKNYYRTEKKWWIHEILYQNEYCINIYVVVSNLIKNCKVGGINNMEINIGDYVRTPNGVIAKIIDIQDEAGQYF